MGNRKHRSGRGRSGGTPPFLDPDFAAALSGGRSGSDVRQQRKDDRKARQLCRQVYQVLSLALAGESGDDVLREVSVDSVEPAAGASRLLVRVALPGGASGASPADVLERLERVRPRLRALVARAITRKRAPELSFLPVAPPSPPRDDEEVRP